MLCVFEMIYRPGTDGEPVLQEETMVHRRHVVEGHDGRPRYLRMGPGQNVPLNPEKFIVREPRTDREWFEARWNALPDRLSPYLMRDAHLRALLTTWAMTGMIPAADSPPVNPGAPSTPPPNMVHADLTEALAWALTGVVENKQAMMAAWTSSLQGRIT